MARPRGRKRSLRTSGRHSISKQSSIQDEIELASSPPEEIQVDNEAINTDDQDEDEEEEVSDEEDEEEEDEDEGDEDGGMIEVEVTPRRRRGRQPAAVTSTRSRGRGRGQARGSTRGRGRTRTRGRGRPAAISNSRENSLPIVTSPTTPGDDEEEMEEVEEEEDIVVKPKGTRGGNMRNRGRGPVGTVIYDSKGNPQVIENDEALLSEVDEAGESKVDLNGNLQGGREYRCRTFTIVNRGERLYMLSTEPARALGFRDSYLFFRNNPVLYKIIATEAEKADMIERELMPPSYKGRAVGLVTARSVFKQYGAKIVVGGRRVIDDYWEKIARADPSIQEGELADPTDILPEDGKPYNRDRYVAWLGASAVYHQQPQSTVPAQPTLLGGRPRKKVHVTDENWMSEHAWSCIHYNEALAEGRQERWLTGYYEPHVDIRFWPKTSQPTMAKWVIVDGEGDNIVVDYEMRRPGFSKAGVGIADLLDREGEEWVDDLGLDEKTKRAILHRGREERRWDAQWRT